MLLKLSLRSAFLNLSLHVVPIFILSVTLHFIFCLILAV